MPRITKDPEERRQEILETAIRLFYQNGYEKTSITDIAQNMNVAQGLCYRYFPSKEVLFDTAIDEYAQLIVGRMSAVLQKPNISLNQLVSEMPSSGEIEADDSFIYKLCHTPESRKIHYQLSMAVCSKLFPIVKNQLDLACERKEIELSDTETAASFFVYGQLGVLLQSDLPYKEREERIRVFLLELIKCLKQ